MTSPALPERLRLETRELHAATERSGAMAALLAGRLPRPGYHALLRNLHALYEALEAALDARQADPAIAPLRLAGLPRAAALAADLQALHGPGWAQALQLTPATHDYVLRLQGLGEGDSPVLVAHAYVRYGGDLQGGQVLARLVARQFGVAEAEATRFYDFGPADQVLALRLGLRAALGALPLNEPAQSQVVAEACWAFEQHQRLFEQLLPAPGARR